MQETLYRRPVPDGVVAFSSPEGRQLFAEALASGGLDGYFPLAEQFHTQSEPSFCGLGSLVVALNALGVDPGRLWKGPWRWFAEELLDCCVPLSRVRERGLELEELGALTALRELPLYSQIEGQVGAAAAEAVTLLVAALAPALAPARHALLAELPNVSEGQRALASELENVRAQLAALAQRSVRTSR